MPKPINIEVAYASPSEQLILPIQVQEGSDIESAIKLSGMLERFPEIDLSINKVGIFSQRATLATILQDGDRIEIYRELIIDPKQTRRNRAKASS